MNGLDATVAMVARFPRVRVIILSMNANESQVLYALRSGGSGYLLKNVSPEELEVAIRAVANGEKHITAAVAKHVLAGLVDAAKASPLERLTLRQREVLQLVAEGRTSKEIAKSLGIAVKTAESHRSELMKTLDIHNVAGLVRYAIRVGLISSDA
jgi:DNA-binding NarL/FixJ family response regulator